jgi:hypothetical protein
MAFFTEVDGVVFSEGPLEGKALGLIREFGSTQNTTLSEVKLIMARKAKQMGGNAICNFTYVQKADKGLHLLKWDKERLNCSGQVILLVNHPVAEAEIPHSLDSKVCPSCAEVIKMAAVRCRFCGQDL